MGRDLGVSLSQSSHVWALHIFFFYWVPYGKPVVNILLDLQYSGMVGVAVCVYITSV